MWLQRSKKICQRFCNPEETHAIRDLTGRAGKTEKSRRMEDPERRKGTGEWKGRKDRKKPENGRNQKDGRNWDHMGLE